MSKRSIKSDVNNRCHLINWTTDEWSKLVATAFGNILTGIAYIFVAYSYKGETLTNAKR